MRRFLCRAELLECEPSQGFFQVSTKDALRNTISDREAGEMVEYQAVGDSSIRERAIQEFKDEMEATASQSGEIGRASCRERV